MERGHGGGEEELHFGVGVGEGGYEFDSEGDEGCHHVVVLCWVCVEFFFCVDVCVCVVYVLYVR